MGRGAGCGRGAVFVAQGAKEGGGKQQRQEECEERLFHVGVRAWVSGLPARGADR